jgi:hypothetical protein
MAADNQHQHPEPVQLDIKEGHIKIEKGRITVHSDLPLPTVPPARSIWHRPETSDTSDAETEAATVARGSSAGASKG